MKSSIDQLGLRLRIQKLKETMFAEERFMSIEQAKIVTDVYREHGDLPRNLLRALALKEALSRIEIRITPASSSSVTVRPVSARALSFPSRA
jgi:formate C-acetyltransferase